MSERLQFLGRFLIFVSVIFVLFYFFVNPYYRQIFNKIAWLLYKSKTPYGEYVTFHVRFFNIIPFLALMLATPKIKILERLKLIGMGLVIIFIIHFLFLLIGHAYTHQAQTFLQRMLSSTSNAIGQVAVPLLVWFGLAHKYIIKTFRPRTVPTPPSSSTEQKCPFCGKKKKGLKEHIRSVHGQEDGSEKAMKRYGR
ncbi:MAG: hypothetical protein JSV84_07970 [Gemmatimonadota bacterium]|nr:MAG: hypothetical protein JSV84_07970 [Gemmatimonadota bacterium]